MCCWGGGGRHCLVLRGTRVPPSCKREPTKIGVLPRSVGMRTPTECGRTLTRRCRSCLLQKQRVLSSKSSHLSWFSRSLLGLGGPPPAATFSLIAQSNTAINISTLGLPPFLWSFLSLCIISSINLRLKTFTFSGCKSDAWWILEILDMFASHNLI